MRKIAKISNKLEGYTKLSELDGQNYNVWSFHNDDTFHTFFCEVFISILYYHKWCCEHCCVSD